MTLSDTTAKHYQHTLADSFNCIGRGLHTGINIVMTVMPAEVNTGYVFVRRDLPARRSVVPARYNTVTDTRLSTTISNEMGTRVSTIEHLLAALRACDIDNARIVLDGPEVPILDGSSEPFIQLIEQVGVKRQEQLRMAIVVTDTVSVTSGNARARIEPAPESAICVDIDFDHPNIGRQEYHTVIDRGHFSDELARARTFGFKEQVDTLKKLGLIQGGSIKNAILLDDDKVLNEEGLRYTDEFVRHKVLDSIGDLALAGCPILGKFTGHKSGHKLNNELLRELMLNEHCWHYTTLAEAKTRWPELVKKQRESASYFDRDATLMRNYQNLRKALGRS